MAEVLSWITAAVGIFGFWLGGKKVWWSWYVNLVNQILWYVFAVVTGYYAFAAASIFYTIVFARNAYLWTRDHKRESELVDNSAAYLIDGTVVRTGTRPFDGVSDKGSKVNFSLDSESYSKDMMELKNKIKKEWDEPDSI